MMLAPVAIASLTLVSSYIAAGFVGRALVKVGKAIARRTRTTKDDRFIAEVEKFVEEHPEAIALLRDLIERARR